MLLHRLTDVETLLTLAGIHPLLDQMNSLIKQAQERTMYVQEYATLQRMTIMGMDNQYLNNYPFNDEAFSKWNQITDLG